MEGRSSQRSPGMASEAVVQDVGRKKTGGEPFATGRLQLPGQ